jgi:hypothetical protein
LQLLVIFVKKIRKYDREGKTLFECLVVVATQKKKKLHQKEDPKELQNIETKNK